MAGTNGGYGRGRPRFTDEQRRDILARHDRGEGAASIARLYGCHPAAVYYHLKTTLRHVPVADRYSVAPPSTSSCSCVRCGIPMGSPGMCLDCVDVVTAVS